MPTLDSNFLINVAKGDGRAVAVLQRLEGEDLVVPFQAALEFLSGTTDREAALSWLHESFRIAHTSDDHLRVAAGLRANARGLGLRPRWGDVQIAANAVVDQSYVLTTNKRHFRQLEVAAWHYFDEPDPPHK